MSVVQTNQGTFQNDVLDHKGLVFVDFYADWCGPCKVTSPLIEELATSGAYKDKIKFRRKI